MKLFRPFFVVFCAASCFGAGLGAGAMKWRRYETVSPIRITEVIDRSLTLDAGTPVVIGDSIVARQRLDYLCSTPTLNAGIGGAEASHLLPLEDAIIERLRPSVVVISEGSNDIYRNIPRGEWLARYKRMIKIAAPAKVFVVALHGEFEHQNEELRAIAVAGGATFVDVQITPEQTTDGLHLNASGQRAWQASVRLAVCPTLPE